MCVCVNIEVGKSFHRTAAARKKYKRTNVVGPKFRPFFTTTTTTTAKTATGEKMQQQQQKNKKIRIKILQR